MSARMAMTSTATAVLAALALALGASGCGDDRDGDRYATAVNAVQERFVRASARLAQDAAPTATTAQQRRRLDRYAAVASAAVRDLRAIAPPDDVETLHRRLVGAMVDYRDAIAAARRELTRGTPRAILAAQTQLTTAVGQIRGRLASAIRAINAALRG